MQVRHPYTVAIALFVVLVALWTVAAARAQDAVEDPDADGYSNEAERRFVCLFHADPDDIEQAYNKAIADPSTPKRYMELLPESAKLTKVREDGGYRELTDPMAIDVIPTAAVHILLVGEGKMHPGPGQHHFAQYVFKEDYTWDFNKVLFRSFPDEGWESLKPLDREIKDASVSPCEDGLEWCVTMERGAQSLRATFVEAVPGKAVDLYGDYVCFLDAFFSDADPLTFDQNDVEVDHDPHNPVYTPAGDSIPDGAQIRQLAAYLENPDFRRGARCGPTRRDIVPTWEENLARAKAVLGESAQEKPYLVNVLAGYTCIGGREGARALRPVLNEKLGLTISCSGFNNRLSTRLGERKTATCDSGFNYKVWASTSRGYEPSLELFDVFVKKTLYPQN